MYTTNIFWGVKTIQFVGFKDGKGRDLYVFNLSSLI